MDNYIEDLFWLEKLEIPFNSAVYIGATKNIEVINNQIQFSSDTDYIIPEDELFKREKVESVTIDNNQVIK